MLLSTFARPSKNLIILVRISSSLSFCHFFLLQTSSLIFLIAIPLTQSSCRLSLISTSSSLGGCLSPWAPTGAFPHEFQLMLTCPLNSSRCFPLAPIDSHSHELQLMFASSISSRSLLDTLTLVDSYPHDLLSVPSLQASVTTCYRELPSMHVLTNFC